MRKTRNKMSWVILLVMMIMLLPTKVWASINIPDPMSEFYVNDFAHVFAEEEEERLLDNAVAFAQNYDGVQVVVSTVESLQGYSVEKYATEMYNKYRIGKNDMGILILLSTGDRDIKVEIGKAMEGILTDAKAGRLLDEYAIPLLKQNKYNEGLILLQEAIIQTLKETLEKEKAENVVSRIATVESSSSYKDEGSYLLASLLFILSIILIIIQINKNKKSKKQIQNLTEQNERENKKLLSQIERLNYEASENERENKKLLSKIESLNYEKSFASANEKALRDKIQSLSSDIKQITVSNDKLNKNLSDFKERIRRAKILYPNLDTEIEEQIAEEKRQFDMAVAAKVDMAISRVINLPAERDNYYEFSKAVSSYDSLTVQQKTYIKADITRVKALYNEALEKKNDYEKQLEEEKNRKKAKEVSDYIGRILSQGSEPSSSRLFRLEEAKMNYNNLDSQAKKYVDQSIINTLNTMYNEEIRNKEMEEERRRKEEEERRRREEEERRRREEEERRRKKEEERRRREEEERRRKEEDERRRKREEEERKRRNYSSSSYSSHYSHSSHSSHPSHSGFGGHSGGAGPSRHF